MRAFIFPGQGSQSVGMGKALADASATAREVFAEVDEALGQVGPDVDARAVRPVVDHERRVGAASDVAVELDDLVRVGLGVRRRRGRHTVRADLHRVPGVPGDELGGVEVGADGDDARQAGAAPAATSSRRISASSRTSRYQTISAKAPNTYHSIA